MTDWKKADVVGAGIVCVTVGAFIGMLVALTLGALKVNTQTAELHDWVSIGVSASSALISALVAIVVKQTLDANRAMVAEHAKTTALEFRPLIVLEGVQARRNWEGRVWLSVTFRNYGRVPAQDLFVLASLNYDNAVSRAEKILLIVGPSGETVTLELAMKNRKTSWPGRYEAMIEGDYRGVGDDDYALEPATFSFAMDMCDSVANGVIERRGSLKVGQAARRQLHRAAERRIRR